MKQTRFLQVFVVVALCGFGWALAQEEAVTIEAMKQLDQQWSEFFAQGDAVGRANLYAEDAISDNVNDEPVMGREAIKLRFLAHQHVEGDTLTFETTEAVTFGNWGYTSGIFTFAGTGTVKVAAQGHYVHIMKMVDGELKMFRSIFDECEGECISSE